VKNIYHVLSFEHLTALMLGARVEMYFTVFPGSKVSHKDDGWMSVHLLDSGSTRDEFRIHPDDEHLLPAIWKFIADNFYILNYKGYEFMVPNHARTTGVVHLPYGFGVFVDADGNELAVQSLISDDYKGEIPAKHLKFQELREKPYVAAKLVSQEVDEQE